MMVVVVDTWKPLCIKGKVYNIPTTKSFGFCLLGNIRMVVPKL